MKNLLRGLWCLVPLVVISLAGCGGTVEDTKGTSKDKEKMADPMSFNSAGTPSLPGGPGAAPPGGGGGAPPGGGATPGAK